MIIRNEDTYSSSLACRKPNLDWTEKQIVWTDQATNRARVAFHMIEDLAKNLLSRGKFAWSDGSLGVLESDKRISSDRVLCRLGVHVSKSSSQTWKRRRSSMVCV